MSEGYEGKRDDFRRNGMGATAPKTKTARAFNARRRPGHKPVTRYREAFAGAAKRNSRGTY